MAAINATLIDTIAACGDVNRNVLASANPGRVARPRGGVRVGEAALRAPVAAHARLSRDLARRREGRGHRGGRADLRPDLPAAQVQGGHRGAAGQRRRRLRATTSASSRSSSRASCRLQPAVGGGLGTTHGEPATYPRLADVVGFLRPEQLLAVAEAVVTTQRDFGDRTNRKHARLKYTIDDRGLDWFVGEITRRQGFALEPRAALRVHVDGRPLRLDRRLTTAAGT